MSEEELDALPVGYELAGGQFVIEKFLGRGGFGITYLARQTSPARRVAVKEFFPSGSFRRSGEVVSQTSSTARDSFERLRQIHLREANALAQFKHANIARYFRLLKRMARFTWYWSTLKARRLML